MVAGSWFRTHRKKVITHGLIILGFLLYAVFLADPLFDRFERIPGESQLHRFLPPAETTDIRYQIDDISTEGHTSVKINGWAYIEGNDADNSQVYIVMKSNDRTYIFDTMLQDRPDVTAAFMKLNLDLDYSGFLAIIPARKISNGEYNVGIYIKKDSIEALQYTDEAIMKSGGTVELIERTSTLQDISLPAESNNIRFNIDCLQQVEGVEGQFVEINGWAYIEGNDADNSQVYIVMKSNDHTYIFDTMLQNRPDVTAAFKKLNLDLDCSGFLAIIPASKIGNGEYNVGLYIKKDSIEALQYTDKAIKKSGSAVELSERISTSQDISLPAESNNIRFNIDYLQQVEGVEGQFMEIDGWAYIEGNDADNSQVYIVMKSNDHTYIFDTMLQNRSDVTAALMNLNLDLDCSGFLAIIPASKIANGEYIIGIYIQKDNSEALQYTDKVLLKSKDAVKLTF